MISIGTYLILPACSFICYEDLKDRAVHWWWFLILFIGSLIHALACTDAVSVLRSTGSNLVFVALMFLGIALYISLRARNWTNPFIAHFGLGDLLFMVAISPIAATVNFIPLLLAGLFISVVTWYLTSLFMRSTVPAAGLLAAFLLFGILLIESRSGHSLYDPLLIAELIHG